MDWYSERRARIFFWLYFQDYLLTPLLVDRAMRQWQEFVTIHQQQPFLIAIAQEVAREYEATLARWPKDGQT